METAQAILMVLGIYVAAPIALGLAVAGAVVIWAHLAKRTEQAKAPTEVDEVAEHAFKA